MTSIEETGKSIEEATQKALESLGVSEDEVDVEIMEEGAKGFLGIGQAPAKVRVTLKELPRPEPKQRPRRQQRPRQEPKQKQEPKQEPKQAAKPQPRPEPRRAPKPAPTPAEETPISAPVSAPEPVAELTPETVAAAAEFGRDLLQRILDALGNGGTAVVKSISGNQVALEIREGDAPRLIGKHGQTINAMQYLVGIAMNRKFQGKMRTLVDVEDYRTRREDALRKQALQLAAQVKEHNQEAVLEALDANERRIIHSTLADDPDVYTYSEGDEPDRHLVISPRK